MNKYTQNNILHSLIHMAQKACSFTICTLFDVYTDTPALVVVEIINEHESVIVFVETCHLPADQKCLQFWLIKSFIKTILKPENSIFLWKNAYTQLVYFLPCGLFTHDLLEQAHFIDVRYEYLQFDRYLFKHNRKGIYLWSLEQVIANIFNECLDLPANEFIWSQGLYEPNRNINNHPALEPLVEYAIKSCLAVTKLVHFMKFHG